MSCSCAAHQGPQEEIDPRVLVEKVASKHRGRPGALIPILQEVQDEMGYLPRPALEEVARSTGLKPAQVYGVVSFYAQFRTEPIGENRMMVCQGTACHVSGAENILEALEDQLGVKEGGTTADGKVTLETVACVGCCSLAPVVMVNQETYGRLTPVKARELAQLTGQPSPADSQ